MRKRLDQYKGVLSPDQVIAGMNAATRHAVILVEDARILFQAERFSSATALAILAIEEAGKVSILRALALIDSPKEAASEWNRYRSHVAKNVMWALPQMAKEGARKLESFRELFSGNFEASYLLEQVKQISLYTDCLGKANWSIPTNVVDKDLAESMLKLCEILIRKREITELEIKLWVKHLKPVRTQSLDRQKEALLAWHSEMVAAGLANNHIISMDEFIS